PKKIPASHSGQWFYEEKPHKAGLLLEDGPFLQENVRKAVSDFCNWVATLGISSLDEELVLKQFDINDQSKPRSNVLRSLRLDQVPQELKYSVGPSALQKPEFFRKPDYDRKPQKPQNPDKPKGVKMRYGAWYLDTKLWKKQSTDDLLVDPKVSCNTQEENFQEELQKQEEFLADLHGTVAFKDFILRRGYRMPSVNKGSSLKTLPRGFVAHSC
ncbi:protein FAM47E-like, partial [Carlito syrichta]|uniref:Protein FAM47E-like n=1 Tax=Carlito syrichta TaxID=1868482 RepID=A0A1U7UCN2_CARSF